MAEVKVKTRQESEHANSCETPENKAKDRFEALSRATDEFLAIAGSEIDHSLSEDSETHNRQCRQQVGE